MQVGWVTLCRTGAMGLQALPHHPQENSQRRIECALVALQVAGSSVSVGADSTQWRTGRQGNTWFVRCAAASAMLRLLHEGQTPQPLQEKATDSRGRSRHTGHVQRLLVKEATAEAPVAAQFDKATQAR